MDSVLQLSPERTDIAPSVETSTGKPLPLQQTQMPGALAVCVLAALCFWSVYKGAIAGFHGSEVYFWITTYAHGVVRRGLTGTLIAPLLQPADTTRLFRVVLAVNRVGLGLIVLVLLLTVARQRRHWRSSWALACIFASAPFLGQTAFLIGFPDGLIALMLMAVIAAAWFGPPLLVLALSITAALFHEFVPLVALPAVCLAACLRRSQSVAARAAIIGSVLVALVGAWLAGHASPEAIDTLTRQLVALGESPGEALHQARWRLTQSAGDDFAMVSALWRQWWLNGLIGLAYATMPSVVICLLGYPRLLAALRRMGIARKPAWRRSALVALYVASCFSPLATLMIAIDLSRLAAFTALTALVTLFCLPPAPLPRSGRSLAACVVVIFMALPVYSLHLPYAAAAHLRLVSPVCPACARAFVGALNFYNRGRSQAQRDEVLTNPAYANAPP